MARNARSQTGRLKVEQTPVSRVGLPPHRQIWPATVINQYLRPRSRQTGHLTHQLWVGHLDLDEHAQLGQTTKQPLGVTVERRPMRGNI